MYTLIELLQSFVIAVVLIYLFKIQREVFPKSYFSSSDLISGIEEAPTKKSIIIRFLIILLFGIISNLIFNNPKIIIFGITLGSFLIVWPGFLNDQNIDDKFLDKKMLLRFLLGLFVVITYLTARLSIILFNLGNEFTYIYFQNFNKEKLVNLVGDSLISLLVISVVGFIYSYSLKSLNEKVVISSNHSYEEDKNEIDKLNVKKKD